MLRGHSKGCGGLSAFQPKNRKRHRLLPAVPELQHPVHRLFLPSETATTVSPGLLPVSTGLLPIQHLRGDACFFRNGFAMLSLFFPAVLELIPFWPSLFPPL